MGGVLRKERIARLEADRRDGAIAGMMANHALIDTGVE
jgi:hypothetical protein